MAAERSHMDILSGVLRELATELDIHYDDEDFFALTPSITEVRAAVEALEKEGLSVPEAARHVLNRYNKAHI